MNKDDVVNALESEIQIMNDSIKSGRIETWALIVGFAGLIALLFSTWESGGVDFIQVGLILLSLFFAGEIIESLSNLKRKPAPIVELFSKRKMILGIPSSPMIYGILITIGLGVILFLVKTDIPLWVFILAIIVMSVKVVFLIIGLIVTGDSSNPFSFTNPKTPKFTLSGNFANGFAIGYKGGFRWGKLIEPCLLLIVLILIILEINTVSVGQSLTNFKIAGYVYGLVFILNIIVQPNQLKSLPALIILKREVHVNSITPEDAYIGLNLSQAGVFIAPTIIIAKNNIINFVGIINKTLDETPDFLSEFHKLSESDKENHQLTKQLNSLKASVDKIGFDIQVQIARNPNTDPILLSIHGEIQNVVTELYERIDK